MFQPGVVDWVLLGLIWFDWFYWVLSGFMFLFERTLEELQMDSDSAKHGWTNRDMRKIQQGLRSQHLATDRRKNRMFKDEQGP